MGTVVLDFGTSRTAMAYFDPHTNLSKPINITAAPDRPNDDQGPNAYSALENVIEAFTHYEFGTGMVNYLEFNTCYLNLGPLAFPGNFGTLARHAFPKQVNVIPSPSEDFMTLKEKGNELQATQFFSSFRPFISALFPNGPHHWIIGRSAGSIGASQLTQIVGQGNATNVTIHYEAVAALLGVMELANESAGNNGEADSRKNDFAILADLGGGFLDISLVTGMRRINGNIQCHIRSIGGYPLGVDRLKAGRFSRTPIGNPGKLPELVDAAIALHIEHYCSQVLNNAREPIHGTVHLVGGGFVRIGMDQQIASSETRLPKLLRDLNRNNVEISVKNGNKHGDTKAMTILGLHVLSSQHQSIGTDNLCVLSDHKPGSFGEQTHTFAPWFKLPSPTWYTHFGYAKDA